MGTVADTCRRVALANPEALAPAAHPSLTGAVLVLTDAAVLLLSGWLGLRLWGTVYAPASPDFFLGLWPVLGLFLLVFAALGLYPGAGINPVEELRATVLGTTGGYLIFAASIYLSKGVGVRSRGVFLASWLCSIVLVPLTRAAARHLFARRSWWGVPVLVLGAGTSAEMTIARLLEQPFLGLKPVACLDDDETKHGECAGIPVAGSLSIASELSAALGIRHAIVAMPGLNRRQLIGVLERMGGCFPHLIVIPDLFGMASLWVSTRDLGGVLGLEIRQNLLLQTNRWLKRALDLLIASAAGLASVPILVVAMLWIKKVSPGPAVYTQEREGENGRTIRVRKLRTMYHNADALLADYLSNNPQARREWERSFKLKQDPRILPGIGHLLRRLSLDELPQLWNVLKGEMSLVGPRPFPYYHLEKFETRFRALRNRVLPGLTGLWQVSARSDGDLAVQEALDTYYIRNWSLWLDIHILARTARAVLSGRGAY